MINVDDRLIEQLNEKQYWLLTHLVKRINKDGVCWPSMETILKDTGWKDWRTVNKVRDELVTMGVLKVKTRMKKEGGQTSNMFIISTDMIGVFVSGSRLQEMQLAPLHSVQGRPLHSMQGEVLTNEVSISSPVAPEGALKNIPYLDIVTWLNQAAQTAYKHTGQKTRKCIDARYNEGFTADDFREVIEYKAATWRSDEKMRGFLRPETLFGPKFESYLQAARSSTHANADTALNDAILTPEEEKGYAEYIKYIHEKYMPIYRSECRVLSKSDWKDYKTCGTMPGLLTALTASERKSLLVRVHDKLSADHHFRAKYPSVYDCYVQNARALANRQNTTV